MEHAMESVAAHDPKVTFEGRGDPCESPSSLAPISSSSTAVVEEAKVRVIQSRWRAHNLRAEIESMIAHEFAAPKISVSRAAQRALLPKLESGALVPLYCSLDTFSCFGSGVYCYMLWIRLMAKVFFAAFLVNLPTMFHNANGGKLSSANWMTIT